MIIFQLDGIVVCEGLQRVEPSKRGLLDERFRSNKSILRGKIVHQKKSSHAGKCRCIILRRYSEKQSLVHHLLINVFKGGFISLLSFIKDLGGRALARPWLVFWGWRKHMFRLKDIPSLFDHSFVRNSQTSLKSILDAVPFLDHLGYIFLPSLSLPSVLHRNP